MNIKSYWDKAMSFDEYLKLAETLAENPDMQQEEYRDYYALGLQRMERVVKTYAPQEDQVLQLKNKNFRGSVLIITEPWCGDAASIVPVVSEFLAQGGVPVRLFLRDADPSLIGNFLTNGAQAIPKVLMADENLEVTGTWGPRPKFGTELLEKFKADPENYPRDQFYTDLQRAYAKDRGREIEKELLALIP